jgi:hypothetical protein
MDQAAAAAIEPPHLQAPGRQFLLLQQDVGAAPRSPHRNQWRMLTEKQAPESVSSPADVVNATILQKLGRFKVDRPQQTHI